MRRARRGFAAVVLVALATLAGGGGGAAAQTAAPKHVQPHWGAKPKHVLIVLFDQMLPKYADQFDMPNFRRIRDAGTNFKNAYLGYMASETVIAHNVITSGQSPKNMGWVDEAYRDWPHVFGKGADEMHITGDLSLAVWYLVTGADYPKLADYLHEAYPGTNSSRSARSRTPWNPRRPPAGTLRANRCPAGASHRTTRRLSEPERRGAGTSGRWREPVGKNVPTYIRRIRPCGRFFINSDSNNDYGTKAGIPVVHVPGGRQPVRAGTSWPHLGGDTWVADAAVEDDGAARIGPGCSLRSAASTRRPHVGRRGRRPVRPRAPPAQQTHVKWQAENADAQLGQSSTKWPRARHGRRDTGRADRRPRGHARPELQGKTGAGSAGDTNWYYGNGLGAPTPYNNPSPALAAAPGQRTISPSPASPPPLRPG